MKLFELLFVLKSDPVRISKEHLNLTSWYILFEQEIKGDIKTM